MRGVLLQELKDEFLAKQTSPIPACIKAREAGVLKLSDYLLLSVLFGGETAWYLQTFR